MVNKGNAELLNTQMPEIKADLIDDTESSGNFVIYLFQKTDDVIGRRAE